MSSNITCECPSRLCCTKCKRFEDDICYCEDTNCNINWVLMKHCKCVENTVENTTENSSVSESGSSNMTCECPSLLYCTKCKRFEDDICYCEDPNCNINWVLMKRCKCVNNAAENSSVSSI